MIDALVLARLERIPARHHGPVRTAERKQRRLLQGRRPDVGGKWLTVDEDIDAASDFVHDELDALGLGRALRKERNDECRGRARDFMESSHKCPPQGSGLRA